MELLSTERNIHLNKTCFALIFTRAECNHLHARWRREGSKNRTLPPRLQEEWPKHQRFLSEVDIKVAPFDVIFDIETFLPFVKMIARPMSLNMPQARTSVDIDRTLKFVNYKVGATQNPYSFIESIFFLCESTFL